MNVYKDTDNDSGKDAMIEQENDDASDNVDRPIKREPIDDSSVKDDDSSDSEKENDNSSSADSDDNENKPDASTVGTSLPLSRSSVCFEPFG